ncbi:hypothetical protein HDU84_008686 [Entophlyctis sp. JEL0112]|nr:hypothetical protein HDU84_008686 [Entophlyctis sp. JEL0112]
MVIYALTFAHVRNILDELSKTACYTTADCTPQTSVRNSKMKLLLKSSILCAGYAISWAPATALRAFDALGNAPPAWLVLWSSVMLAVAGCWNAAAFFVVAFWRDHACAVSPTVESR